LCGKCSENKEDADIEELCGSEPPHPVRCPVYITIACSNTQVMRIKETVTKDKMY